MGYIPLYVKTNYTLLSSMIKIDDLIEKAKELKVTTLAITDQNLYGAMEFYQKCKKAGIRPIIGLEILFEEVPVVLYAQNQNGYKNLCKIATITSKSAIQKEEFIMYSADLLVILPFASRQLYEVLQEIFSSIFIGYETAEEAFEIISGNAIYFKEILYLESSDREYLPYLYAIRDGVLKEHIDVLPDDNSFVISEKLYKDNKQDHDSTQEFVTMCQLELTFEANLLPKYPVPEDIDSHSYLKKLCKIGLENHFGNIVEKRYIERLKYELDVIQRMGFSDYFLIVWDYVAYARRNQILVGPGRGSAAGSLVSYCLHITDVDPIKYHLLFERFLNLERVTMPDIDIDFEDERREEIIQYCINKYGKKRVAPIITFGTLTAKQAVRDVGRAMDVDLKVIDYISKLLDSKFTLQENYQKNEVLKKLLTNDAELMKLYQISLKFEGLKRHSSMHAAGIVMANTDLDDIIPLESSREDYFLTGYTMEYLEAMGLLKMDFLAIRTLTVIQKIIRSVNQTEAKKITFQDIPLGDAQTISLFEEANTMGIFQFESSGMIQFLRKYRPNHLEDIFATIALFRPGPMQNIDHYINRKNGKERVEYLHPDLEAILKPTYGIIVYQEQIMQLSSVLAGYTLGEADVLRRAMSKKNETLLRENRQKFISNSIKRGYTEELSNQVYDLIMRFAEYGFPRAHAVAYSIIAYKMAYLKVYFPHHFFRILLSMSVGSEMKIKEYIQEAKMNHITILMPDINISLRDFIVEKTGIRYPLSGIKNLGNASIQTILQERENGLFIDIFDFVTRVYGRGANRKVIESLIDSGSLDCFGFNKRTLHENLDLIINYGELSKDLGEEFSLKPNILVMEEFEKSELLKREISIYGFYLTNHPVTEYKLAMHSQISIVTIYQYFDKTIELVALVDHTKEIVTKTGKKMCFLVISDESSSMDAVLFPDIYEKNQTISVGNVIKINGRVEKRFDKYQLVVNQVRQMNMEDKKV